LLDLALEVPPPLRGRRQHGFAHQRLLRGEVRIEAAMGQAGVGHQVDHAGCFDALLAKAPGRSFHHAPVRFRLVFLAVAHRKCSLRMRSLEIITVISITQAAGRRFAMDQSLNQVNQAAAAAFAFSSLPQEVAQTVSAVNSPNTTMAPPASMKKLW